MCRWRECCSSDGWLWCSSDDPSLLWYGNENSCRFTFSSPTLINHAEAAAAPQLYCLALYPERSDRVQYFRSTLIWVCRDDGWVGTIDELGHVHRRWWLGLTQRCGFRDTDQSPFKNGKMANLKRELSVKIRNPKKPGKSWKRKESSHTHTHTLHTHTLHTNTCCLCKT